MTQHPWTPDGGEQSAPPVGDPESESAEGIRFRDKRKVDPETYEVREDQAAADAPTPEGEIPVQPEVADDRVAELTLDLQRLSAEFANYRRRVDRDRELNQDRAVAEVVEREERHRAQTAPAHQVATAERVGERGEEGAHHQVDPRHDRARPSVVHRHGARVAVEQRQVGLLPPAQHSDA